MKQLPWLLATEMVVQGPATWASPGTLLDMQNCNLHPRPAESESARSRDSQVTLID